MVGPVTGKKYDCTTSTMLPAHVNQLWPLVTDLQRWPGWFKDAKGQGLASIAQVAPASGKIDPLTPSLGGRWRMEFTNGFAGEWEMTYHIAPAQLSLGMVKGTAQRAQGVQHFILDLDFFPRGEQTQLWFGATVILEPKVKPGLLARWPQREVQSWVQGFHRHVAAEAQRLRGFKTKRDVEAEAAAR
ncbi:MAG: hypothetical protein LC624_12600 [Halobacteriales archaeon]|nr:hypothetical protein [Halobacteriales archaeon]